MKKMALLLSISLSSWAMADLCKYSAPKKVGTVQLREASGLAVSTQYPNRAYMHNDSGDGPNVFATSLSGVLQMKTKIIGSSPSDNEDMSLGPCGDKVCIFVGDIGDNKFARSGGVSVATYEEQEILTPTVNLKEKIYLKYPDGAKNAESMAVHPNGNLYIITKKYNSTTIYYVKKNDLWDKTKKIKVLTKLAKIEIGKNVATGMSISPSGKKFIVITYTNAYEFAVDLGELNANLFKGMIKGTHYQEISLKKLAQQEAIGYVSDMQFLYSSEKPGSSLMQLECVLQK